MSTPDGEVTARARLLMCSSDLPAKALLLNMKQYNGQHGCSYCEDEGVPRPTTHLHRNWPYSESSTLRTHSGLIANADEARKNGEPVSIYYYVHHVNTRMIQHIFSLQVMGVKGTSVLSRHNHFNLANGVVIDVMHCVFLGVVAKTLMKYWLDTAHRTAPFSIRRKVDEHYSSGELFIHSPCTIIR